MTKWSYNVWHYHNAQLGLSNKEVFKVLSRFTSRLSKNPFKRFSKSLTEVGLCRLTFSQPLELLKGCELSIILPPPVPDSIVLHAPNTVRLELGIPSSASHLKKLRGDKDGGGLLPFPLVPVLVLLELALPGAVVLLEVLGGIHGQYQGLQEGHMVLDTQNKVVDQELRVEHVPRVGRSVGLILVLVSTHANHLHHIRAGQTLLSYEHQVTQRGDADQTGVLHDHVQLPAVVLPGGTKVSTKLFTFPSRILQFFLKYPKIGVSIIKIRFLLQIYESIFKYLPEMGMFTFSFPSSGITHMQLWWPL